MDQIPLSLNIFYVKTEIKIGPLSILKLLAKNQFFIFFSKNLVNMSKSKILSLLFDATTTTTMRSTTTTTTTTTSTSSSSSWADNSSKSSDGLASIMGWLTPLSGPTLINRRRWSPQYDEDALSEKCSQIFLGFGGPSRRRFFRLKF